MRGALVATAVVGAAVAAVWALGAALRALARAGEDRVIAGLIKAPRYRFEGMDEGLRETAARKRAAADRSRRLARRIESTPNDMGGLATFERKVGRG